MRLKEVVYTLSPFEQNVMAGLWKDLPHKASHYGSLVSALHDMSWERRDAVGHACAAAAAAAAAAAGSLLSQFASLCTLFPCRPRMHCYTAPCPCLASSTMPRISRRRRRCTTVSEHRTAAIQDRWLLLTVSQMPSRT